MSSDGIKESVGTIADGQLEPANGAERIAQIVSQQQNLEGALYSLWTSIIDVVVSAPSTQPRLVDLLVSLSQLPDVHDSAGSPVMLNGSQLWSGLPTLGWEINAIWNSLSIPKTQPQRSEAIDVWVNKVHFTALLVATEQPVFQAFRLQILWTFRGLESPTNDPDSPAFSGPDIDIPAIAAVVDVLGAGVRSWVDEYESSPTKGAPGRGGPLWDGKQGFSPGRYDLWKHRLEEISHDEGVSASIQKLAADTAAKM